MTLAFIVNDIYDHMIQSLLPLPFSWQFFSFYKEIPKIIEIEASGNLETFPPTPRIIIFRVSNMPPPPTHTNTPTKILKLTKKVF